LIYNDFRIFLKDRQGALQSAGFFATVYRRFMHSHISCFTDSLR